MNLAELKEAYKARKLALDSAKKEEEKYKALLKDAMLEAGESDYTDEAGYRFERIVQERKSMDEEKLLAELHPLCMAVSVCYFSREYTEAPRMESRVR